MNTHTLPSPAQFAQPGFDPATISHEGRIRYLHLGSSWIQGALDLRAPERLQLEYVRKMMCWQLFMAQPRHIVQLGLGSGALTRFCLRHFPDARVTAVELNPNVLAACRAHFLLPPDDARFQVCLMDAAEWVTRPDLAGTVDILQVDIYDAAARGPARDSAAFYAACHACLSEQGMLVVNIFGGNYQQNLDRLEAQFDACVWLTAEEGENLVALAFKQAPQVDFAILFARAAQIHRQTGLRAKAWVLELKEWMAQQ
ncbi:spermidine synthase [Massilia sp. W12]|uniref:spermine/spermidine synthase domain-containing protein n=1 Tax=Massilia sp. W12 TaxID=3126507 RepID=UPI0030CAD1FB